MTESMVLPRPQSAVSQFRAFLSFFGFIGVIAGFRWFGSSDAITCFASLAVALALPHIWQATTGEWPAQSKPESRRQLFHRLILKMAGLAVIYGLLAAFYFAFHGYYEAFVKPLRGVIEVLWLPLLTISPIYVWLTDRLMDDPYDGLYQVGLAVSGSFSRIDRSMTLQYLLGWAVKGFFIPLMVGYALNDIRWFLSGDFLSELERNGGYYFFAYRFIFFIDVTFAAVGYLCAMRLIGTHIRSTEPTTSGWVVCIICYEPFWPLFSRNFFPYEDGFYWNDWLAHSSGAWFLWCSFILTCLVVYVWGSISFGIRFSNLTNRGILTNGPYRWLKHPHYVSKNISWWLVSVPFMTNQPPEIAVRNCLLLLAVNGIYYLRAITEERHLSRDPAYVTYCAWMRENSIYAMLKRIGKK